MTLGIGTTVSLIIILFFWHLWKWLFRVLFTLLIGRGVADAVDNAKQKIKDKLGGRDDDSDDGKS